MASNLDFPQCIKGAFNDSTQSARSNSSLAIEIAILPGATLGAIDASVLNAAGASRINLYAIVGASGLATAACAKIQYSPSDEDAIWFDAGVVLASATAAASANLASSAGLLARRVRLNLLTAPSGGDVSFYILGS